MHEIILMKVLYLGFLRVAGARSCGVQIHLELLMNEALVEVGASFWIFNTTLRVLIYLVLVGIEREVDQLEGLLEELSSVAFFVEIEELWVLRCVEELE